MSGIASRSTCFNSVTQSKEKKFQFIVHYQTVSPLGMLLFSLCNHLKTIESSFILLTDFAESANYRFSPLLSDTRRLVRYCILPGRVQYSTDI